MDFLRSDCMLREILEERKSLAGFLDAVFGFMSRNTDFYHIQRTKDDKLGFPRGFKEQILLSCMRKYEYTFEEQQLKRDLIIEEPPPAVEEIEIVADEAIELANVNKDIDTEKSKTLEAKENAINVSKFNESEYRNGSLCENYCWSQTLKDIELSVLLPKEVKLGKHINMYLTSSYINIKALLPKEEILISGDTWDKYRHKDIVWTITDGRLLLSLDKLKECWWDKLFLNENAINIKEVDARRPIDEYSEETQKAIEKMHTEHILKQDLKTLPLSESEQLARLRQAWNAEGSPFKDLPFDPSVVKFN